MKANKLTKTLSFLVAFAMVFTMMPLSIFADGTTLPAVTVAHNGNTYTASGTNGESIAIQKNITKVADTDDQFDIALNVTTVSNSTTTIAEGKAAHVVLVLDTSGSMADDNRLVNAKTAANAFIDVLLNKGNSKNEVALVTYASAATKQSDLTHTASTLTAKITGLNAKGGTNTQEALKMARDILAADVNTDGSEPVGVSKIIVLLSDGEPTFSYRLSATGKYESSKFAVTKSSVTCDYKTPVGDGTYFYGSSDTSWLENMNLKYSYVWYDGGTYNRSDNFQYNYLTNTVVSGKKASNHGSATIWEADQSKTAGTEIYSIILSGTTDAKTVMKNIATADAADATVKHYQETSDVSALTGIFKNIANTVNNATGGSTVTDPMSSLVTLTADSIKTNTSTGAVSMGAMQTGEAAVANNTISWDLSKAIASTTTATGNNITTTTNVYKLTYRITVNRSAAFYDAVLAAGKETGVATNGTTTVKYTMGGTEHTANFDVPRVTSEMPTVDYTIQYFKKNKTDSNYTEVTGDKTTGSGSYGDTISAPSDYQTKYLNYNFNHAVPTGASVKLGLIPGDNVIQLYYDPISTRVQVNHYYTTWEHQVGTDGKDTLVKTQDNEPKNPETHTDVYVGDTYTATEHTHLDDRGDYTPAAGNVKTVTLAQTDNVINLYYERILDVRAAASYDVDHIYTLRTYVIDADGNYTGKYTDTVASHTPCNPITGNVGDTVTANEQPQEGYVNQGAATQTLTLKAGTDNHIVFNYLKTVDLENASATVQYTYTTVTKSYENGVLQTSTSTETWDRAPDETLNGKNGQIVSIPKADREGYTWDSGNTSNVTLSTTAQTVTVNYTRTIEPVTTSITVTHHYTRYEWDTTTNKWAEKDSPADEVVTGTGYVGNHYTIQKKSNGYTYTTGGYPDATAGVVTLKTTGNEFTLNYELKVQQEADLTVTHHYTVTVRYIDANGQIATKTETYETSAADDQFTGHAGDAWTATIKVDHGCTLNPGQTTSGYLAGADQKVDLYYTGNRDDRGAAVTATVVYNYYTFSASLKDGVPSWSTDLTDATQDGTQTVDSTGTWYAGQLYSADITGHETYNENTYSLKNAVPETKQITLDADSAKNVITINLSRNVNTLPTTSVAVRHIYTHHIKEVVDGKYVTRTVVEYNPKSGYTMAESGLYVGNTWSAKTYVNAGNYTLVSTNADLTITLNESGNNVDINYVLTDPDVAEATLIVKHHYKTYDENGALISDEAYTYTTIEETKTSKAGVVVTAVENTQQGLFTNDGAQQQTITLAAGENTITFEYSRRIETRQNASVTVNHVYQTYDVYTKQTTDDTKLNHSETTSTARDDNGFITNGIYVGASFTAVPDNTANYAVKTPAANMTITLAAAATDGNPNVITINYLRTVDSTPEPDPTPDYSYYTVTVNYLNQADNSVLAQPHSETHREYTSYDVTAYDKIAIEGYTYAATSGDQLTGTLNGNKVINVYYTVNEPVIIPDEPTPGGDKPVTPTTPTEPTNPGTEIIDDNTPMGNLPNTGAPADVIDPVTTLGLVALILSMLAAGLGITHNGRRKDEDDAQ